MRKLKLIFVFILLLFSNTSKSQDISVSKIKLNLSADIMSRYIWRGSDYGNSPNIQPTLSLSMANFEIGCWSAVATNNDYKEVDLYAKYTYKKISLIFTDYYIPSINGSSSSPDNRYFIYGDKKTAHSFEGSLLFKGGEDFPLWLQGSVFFYGNDKRWGYDAEKDITNKTYYSSYFEAGYTFAIQEKSVDLFIGFTPSAGAYGNTLGVVNVGITGYYKIKISEVFELPLKTSLVFNPQTSNVYIAFGITL
ncbi:MAG: hypothetical protein ABFC28_01050 [Rikenellaceae bacterium]